MQASNNIQYVLNSFRFLAKEISMFNFDRKLYVTNYLELANKIKTTYCIENPQIQYAIDLLMKYKDNEITFRHLGR